MRKHTPGPWDASAVGNGAEFEITSDGWFVAVAFDGVNGQQNAEANARLIAAAPRMFTVIEAGAKSGDAECVAIVEAVYGRDATGSADA